MVDKCILGISCVTEKPPVNGEGPGPYSLFSPGDVVSYNCNDGYTMYGEANITCQSSGMWSSEPPKCEGEYISIVQNEMDIHRT